MEYIVKDKVIYEFYMTPVDVAAEEKKLAWMEQALIEDAQAAADYQKKLADVEATTLDKEIKDSAKSSLTVSPSGVTNGDYQRQLEKVTELHKLLSAPSDTKPTK